MINRLRPSLFRAVVVGLISLGGFTSALAVHVCKDFELLDSRGRSHSLSDAETPIKVIAFLGTECPLAKLYSQRLNALSKEFEGRVTVYGLVANCQDSNSDIANFARKFELQFPLLKDLRNQVADQLEATRTPEVFLLDQLNRVRYQGRIDDQYGVGYSRPRPTKSELRDAIQCLLNKTEIQPTKTQAVGCIIGRLPQANPNRLSKVTYESHIVPLLEKHCIECHQDDEIAPFSLDSYDEVVGWGETIREVVESNRMPPWHASPEFGEFHNERVLSQAEKALIVGWIEGGMPRSDSKREPVATPRPGGWQLPTEPDLVLSMNSNGFTVPAEGTVEYLYFVVDPELAEDRWISAAQVRPGNRAVVHHVIVFVRPPEGERQSGLGWLTGYVPGQSNLALPEGFARRIPAGSKLVFQMHYTPVGSEVIDKTSVGLVFRDESLVHTEVQTRLVLDRDFEIPPQASDYAVRMSATSFAPGTRLMGIAPHMHYRGNSFRVSLMESPRLQSNDKESEGRDLAANTLLYVPNYDFNWQHLYLLKDPVPLHGKTISCTAVFDNSHSNPVNPDPTATVRWGDQTWEEMAMAYVLVSTPRENQKPTEPRSIVSEGTKADAWLSPQQREHRAQQLANDFFKRLDKNQDDEILRSETPKSFRAFAWRLYDRNQDDKLTRDEVLQQARISAQQ